MSQKAKKPKRAVRKTARGRRANIRVSAGGAPKRSPKVKKPVVGDPFVEASGGKDRMKKFEATALADAVMLVLDEMVPAEHMRGTMKQLRKRLKKRLSA